jgi:hypothetical protein
VTQLTLGRVVVGVLCLLRGVRSHRRYCELVAKIGLADVVVAPAAR